ncbi:ATP-binding cassette (ABC) Superfamily [Phytophthora cinnamomi]|uniref:ATP-binding cassette (ABC) Superfamily n=1 Tax=Phytophthora cinnamomi TaxID=4785 RepID=UPI00355AB9A6|nr:ATP-binding cassette (ABC) Superfamily [Phytophthora cinnamomi]
MPPKRSSRGEKAPSKPRAERPKAKKAKTKNESAALKEPAMGTAAKEVRSPSSSPEESRGEHTSRKSSNAPPDEGDNPRFSYERCSPRWDWDSPEFSCTKVIYSGRQSNAPAAPDTQAEEPSSGKTGTEPMAATPVKNLTLAEGLARAQASKAATAVEGDAPGGKKRAASKSPPRDCYRGLFDDSESEEGAVDESREVSNDLDEQQAQYYSAGSAAHAGQATAPATATADPLSGGGAARPKGYYPPDDGTGSLQLLKKLTPPRGVVSGYTSRGAYERALVETSPLFVSDIEATRCLLLAPHKILLKEFTNLRKKAEDKGRLHPGWGYPWVKPSEAMTWIEVEDLFWRYVSRKGYSDQEYKELREDRLLSSILDQRDLRVEFAHLVSKRNLYPMMEKLKQQTQAKAREERGRGATSSATVPHHNSIWAVSLELFNRIPRIF